ncbi:MAG TPA: amino acid adenylation domain-containing protein, partial [Candidatus Dormibacteraeota bacterium]|nr:amino acid adenylation domain-containing protein [Candidatus Dormibacteraeota bacterium]
MSRVALARLRAASTLVGLLRRRADETPDGRAFTFLADGEEVGAQLTYAALDVRARAVAAALQARGAAGGRALLLFPSGLEFVTAFLGCAYAGVTAVPCHPPRPPRSRDSAGQERFLALAQDAAPSAVLASADIAADWGQHPALHEAWTLTPDAVPDAAADGWRDTCVAPDALALLQYTSGSVAAPKGVMVSHANLLENMAMLVGASCAPDDTTIVSWLPFYHDMGLIGTVLVGLAAGGGAVLMAPLHFLQRPVRWLNAISRETSVASGGPNFAYDLCVQRVTPEQRETLDLRSWTMAFSGAEPVRQPTLEAFARTFEPHGFRRAALFPTYGLAEATLMVAGGYAAEQPACHVDAEALERGDVASAGAGRSRALVACGPPVAGQRVLIVDPETARPCPPGRVGEIWVRGPNVAAGYWRRPQETQATFGACLAGVEGEGPFLRTGDLGFLHGGRLVVTGRRKDLIIVRGRNLYPQDVELAAEGAHPAARSSFAAAFSVDVDDEERLVVVQAVRPQPGLDAGEVAAAIRRAVADAHEVEVHAVVLVRPAAIPRTTSGKLRRQACRAAYLTGTLDPIAVVEAPSAPEAEGRAGEADPESVIRAALARTLDREPGDIDLGVPLAALGLDSLRAMELWNAVERALGVALPTDLLAAGAPTAADLVAAATAATEVDPLPAAAPDPERRHEPFPLTDLQYAYLIGRGDALPLGGVATHVYVELESRDLDLGRLEVAWRRVIDRHDMLRAVVLADGRQRVLPTVPSYRIETLDLRGVGLSEAEPRLCELRERLSHEVRPTDRWPLFDVRASLLDGGRVRLHVSLDLLIADVWSCRLLLDEWAAEYAEPGSAGAARPALGFRDYVLAERGVETTERYRRARAYWLERLDALPPAPDLPLRKAPESVRRPRFRRRSVALDAATWARLRERAAVIGVTPTTVVLAAFARALAAWSRSPRFTLNLTLFNRHPLHRDVDRVVGDFTSVNLLEVDLTEPDGLAAVAERVGGRLWRDLEHRWFGGVRVLRELARARGGPGALMPVVFTSALGLGDLPLDWLGRMVDGVSQTPQVWLDHQVFERDGELVLSWDAVDELFPPGLLDDLLGAYAGFLRALAEDDEPWQRDDAYDWLPARQRQRRAAVNATAGPVPGGLLQDAFLAWAAREPSRAAVIAPDRTLTYGELARLAGGVACRLRALGIGRGELVAVSMPKGWEQVAAVLGVLRAGAAYLPVDPDLPPERVSYLADHGQVRAAVVSLPPGGGGPGWGGFPERVQLLTVGPESDAAPSPATPDDLAYVIYTSGSTGLPKGVAVTHRSALNTVIDVNERFGVGPGDRVLALSSLSFDLSVYDIFGLLAAGGALVLPEPAAGRDPARWHELMAAHRVTVWNTVPALMQMLVDHAGRHGAPGLRLVLLSGDWIPLRLPDGIRAAWPDVRTVGLGGATEAAIWSNAYDVERVDPAWESIPYGFPLRNQRFDVLDDRLRPRPAWVAGQLHIGGIGLAQGYWRDEERTSASFVTDPATGERLYRTGDLGRYWPDGTLEFLGREDTQVKVHGYRIELGEVEAALAEHPSVLACVVAAVGDRHDRRLVACVVPRRQETAGHWTAVWTIRGETDQELVDGYRAHLEERLPPYMVPAAYLLLDELPLTSNGKVDRRALTAAAGQGSALVAGAGTRPAGGDDRAGTPAERRLAALVCDVVGVERVSPRDNLFDLGLDSLSAARVAVRIRDEFGVDPPYRQIFETPTVEALARTVLQGAAAPEAPSDDLRAEVALDPAIRPTGGARPPTGEPAHVLLTGATGFVGGFLLASLLRRTNATIHCLVRSADAALGRERLLRALRAAGVDDPALAERLVAVPGDVAAARLGLSE